MSIVDGQVVRFIDAVQKKRPAIVISVRENGSTVLLEGTTKAHWKEDGEPILMEVHGGTRICVRMGLSRHKTTYFYGSLKRLKFVATQDVLEQYDRVKTCPDAEFRKMQMWAFDVLESSGSRLRKRLPDRGKQAAEVNTETADK